MKYFFCKKFTALFSVIFYIGLACGTIDPLIAGLCHQATAQIQILKENLQCLGRDVKFSSTRKTLISSEKIFQRIKKCVQHHEVILKYYYLLTVLFP